MIDDAIEKTLRPDVLILGGGAAGLWTLDELTRQGYQAILIESFALGSGQTVASQGIIHGGLKYTLTGALTTSAQFIRQMPLIWRDCFAGKSQPNLAAVKMRSQFCYLWRTESLMSQLGMVGARVGLRVKPNKLDKSQWPDVLANCPGSVYKLEEQVMSPASFVRELARPHMDRILHAAPEAIEFHCPQPGVVEHVTIRQAGDSHTTLRISPRHVLLTAGQGNASLREKVGLDPQAMQRRPLHMVVARGSNLPLLNGHCVDGAKTRVTITTETSVDDAGVTQHVWQVGGQVSEDGVSMEPEALLRHAIAEVRASLPGVNLQGVQWSTYRVDRAEAVTESGLRPDDVHLQKQGNVFTAWPTKLALAPRLASHLLEQLGEPEVRNADSQDMVSVLQSWPRPEVAKYPWEAFSDWRTTEQLT